MIRWCVKAPLAHKRKKKTPLANGHVAAKVPKDSGGAERDSHLLYSKLHLSVLQVLLMLQAHLTEKNLYGRLGLVLFEASAASWTLTHPLAPKAANVVRLRVRSCLR